VCWLGGEGESCVGGQASRHGVKAKWLLLTTKEAGQLDTGCGGSGTALPMGGAEFGL